LLLFLILLLPPSSASPLLLLVPLSYYPSQSIWNCVCILQTVGTGDRPVSRPPLTQDSTKPTEPQTPVHISSETQPTIPMLERANIFHDSDGVAAVTGSYNAK
jgi:hypothetical protein